MKLDNKYLNQRLAEISERIDLYEAFGGKAIPYIGWFWREVDFNHKGSYAFGVIPVIKGDPRDPLSHLNENTRPRVGFMPNNKWDYETIEASISEWEDIKELVVEAVDNPSYNTLKALDDKIQSLYKGD